MRACARKAIVKLGIECISLGNGLAVYAKLTPKALYALQCRQLMALFNQLMDRTTINRIKTANKFLRKHGLDELVSLSEYDLDMIKKGGFPPHGSLLCRLDESQN